MKDSQQTQHVQTGVLPQTRRFREGEHHLLAHLKVFSGEFVSKEHDERICPIRRKTLGPELVRSLPLTVPLATFTFFALEKVKNKANNIHVVLTY